MINNWFARGKRNTLRGTGFAIKRAVSNEASAAGQVKWLKIRREFSCCFRLRLERENNIAPAPQPSRDGVNNSPE